MIIDFHTHTFPDEIAERTIHKLEAAAGIHARVNGTLAGLKTSIRTTQISRTNWLISGSLDYPELNYIRIIRRFTLTMNVI